MTKTTHSYGVSYKLPLASRIEIGRQYEEGKKLRSGSLCRKYEISPGTLLRCAEEYRRSRPRGAL